METVPTVFIVNPDVVANSLTKQLLTSINIFSRDFQSPSELLKQDLFYSPSCFLISFLLPEFSGLELMRRLRQAQVFHPCIFTSPKIEHELIVKAMHNGGYGFIKKPFDAMEFIELIQKSLEYDQKTQHSMKVGIAYKQNHDRLTDREKQILSLILKDFSATKIAALLKISHRTVENHRNKIFSKLNVSKISELIRIAAVYDTLNNTGLID